MIAGAATRFVGFKVDVDDRPFFADKPGYIDVYLVVNEVVIGPAWQSSFTLPCLDRFS